MGEKIPHKKGKSRHLVNQSETPWGGFLYIKYIKYFESQETRFHEEKWANAIPLWYLLVCIWKLFDFNFRNEF